MKADPQDWLKEHKVIVSEQQKVRGGCSGVTFSQANEPFGPLNSVHYVYV